MESPQPTPVHMPRFKTQPVILNRRPRSAGPTVYYEPTPAGTTAVQGMGAAPLMTSSSSTPAHRAAPRVPRAGRQVSRVPDAYPNLFVSGASVQKQLEAQHAELHARCKLLTEENERLRAGTEANRQRAELIWMQEASLTNVNNSRDQLRLQLQESRETVRALQHDIDMLQNQAVQPLSATERSTVSNAVNEALSEIYGVLGIGGPEEATPPGGKPHSRVRLSFNAADGAADGMKASLETTDCARRARLEPPPCRLSRLPAARIAQMGAASLGNAGIA
eukprot:6895368-Prymnesium_polylepis.1